MAIEAVTLFAAGHRLCASSALGTACAKVEDSLAPVAVLQALLDKGGDGINFKALRAPAEDAIRRRIAASDNVDPKGLFWRRFEQLRFDVQLVLFGESPHAIEGALDALGNGRYLDSCVGAENCNGFFALFGRSGQDGVEHE